MAQTSDNWTLSDRLAVALACAGAAMALILFLIEKTPFTVGVMVVGIAALLIYPILHFVNFYSGRVAAIFIMFLLVGVFAWNVWPTNKSIKVIRIPPRTLYELFEESPEGYMRIAPKQKFSFIPDHGGLAFPSISSAMLIDRSNTYAVYFYIPLTDHQRTFGTCIFLADEIGGPWDALKNALTEQEKWGFSVASKGTDRQRVGNPTFSRKVIFFTEQELSLSEKGDIDEAYTSRNLSVEFRDLDFLQQTMIDRQMSN